MGEEKRMPDRQTDMEGAEKQYIQKGRKVKKLKIKNPEAERRWRHRLI